MLTLWSILVPLHGCEPKTDDTTSPRSPADSGGSQPSENDAGVELDVDASEPQQPADAGAVSPPEVLIPAEPPPDDARAPASFLVGTIWAPGNGPGQVPDKEEIPVAGALVQLTQERPKPLQEGVFCESCVDSEGTFTVTDHRGEFRLGPFTRGTFWLSLRKGQFRLEREIFIEEDGEIELSSQLTTLPSVHDPERGQILPKMAIATGQYDTIENVIGKMGIGGVTSAGAWRPDGPGAERIDLWNNGGAFYDEKPALGPLEELVRDYDQMSQYHVIFIPCTSGDGLDVLRQPEVLTNLQRYVADGGKLYVTDWAGHWHDNVFPAHVQFSENEDTPPEAYDFETNTWDTDLFRDTAGASSYDSDRATAIDPDLANWLDEQWGPIVDNPNPFVPEHYGEISASNFPAFGSWARIEGVHDVQVGVDQQGNEVLDIPRVFVDGDRGESDAGAARFPLTVSYQPVGCGRVLYSTYHTTGRNHPGLLPQERILLYLIMEMTVCRPGLPPVAR